MSKGVGFYSTIGIPLHHWREKVCCTPTISVWSARECLPMRNYSWTDRFFRAFQIPTILRKNLEFVDIGVLLEPPEYQNVRTQNVRIPHEPCINFTNRLPPSNDDTTVGIRRGFDKAMSSFQCQPSVSPNDCDDAWWRSVPTEYKVINQGLVDRTPDDNHWERCHARTGWPPT